MEKSNLVNGEFIDRMMNIKITLRPNQQHHLEVIKDKEKGVKTDYWWKCNEEGLLSEYKEITGNLEIYEFWKYNHKDRFLTYHSNTKYLGDTKVSELIESIKYDDNDREIYKKTYINDTINEEYGTTTIWKKYDEDGKCTEYTYNPDTRLGKIRAHITNIIK